MRRVTQNVVVEGKGMGKVARKAGAGAAKKAAKRTRNDRKGKRTVHTHGSFAPQPSL